MTMDDIDKLVYFPALVVVVMDSVFAATDSNGAGAVKNGTSSVDVLLKALQEYHADAAEAGDGENGYQGVNHFSGKHLVQSPR